MIKSELVQKIANKLSDIPISKINTGVSLLTEQIINALHHGYRVEIRGFGAFSLRVRKSRMACNPKTKEKKLVDSKSFVYFRASKKIDLLNKL